MKKGFSNISGKASNRLVYLLVFLLTQLFLAIFIGKAYFAPSEYVYTTHGDGGIIYYDMLFHALHGSGFLLENMNYPRFESIFMTDAQASVSIVLSWFGDYLSPETIIACIHLFHYIMFGFAVVYMYKALEVLGVRRWLAIASALLIIFLSPLTFRLQAGHYGLFYPFVFSYTFYYIIKVYLGRDHSILGMIKVLLVLLFFGLNNFYLIGINSALLLLMAIGSYFSSQTRNRWWRLATPATLSLVFAFLCIHFSDIGSDRIDIQWGYYDNSTSFLGVFVSPYSLAYDLFSKFTDVPITYGESWLNLGFSPMLVVLVIPFFFRSMSPFNSDIPPLLRSFLFAGIILLIYASAILYDIEFFRENIFHKMRLASMFKASGRFSIPIYFMFSICVVLILSKLMERKTGLYLTVFFLALWTVEANMFLRHHTLGRAHDHHWRTEILDSYRVNLPDADEYQALYTLPVMEKWNDKISIKSNSAADYEARLISLATGLPMINAALSRIGLSDAERAIQMASSPLIRKEIVDILPSDKPILLVTRANHQDYTIGEQYLIDVSEVVHEDKGNVWRRLRIEDINDHERLAYAKERVVSAGDSIYTDDGSFFTVEHFEEGNSVKYFSEPNAFVTDQEQLIYQTELPDTLSGGHEISLYCHVNPKLFGNPTFIVKTYGEQEAEIKLTRSISKDNYIDWVRVWGWMDIPRGSTRMEISIVAVNQPYYIDDICIKKFESELVDGKNGFYNNYRF